MTRKRSTEVSSFSPLNDFIKEVEVFIKYCKTPLPITNPSTIHERALPLEAALKHLLSKKHRTTRREYQRAYDRYEYNADGDIAVDFNGLRDETELGGVWVSAWLLLPPTPGKRKSLTKGLKL